MTEQSEDKTRQSHLDPDYDDVNFVEAQRLASVSEQSEVERLTNELTSRLSPDDLWIIDALIAAVRAETSKQAAEHCIVAINEALLPEVKRAESLREQLKQAQDGFAKFHTPGCEHAATILVGNCCEGNDVALDAMAWRDKAFQQSAEVARLRSLIAELVNVLKCRFENNPHRSDCNCYFCTLLDRAALADPGTYK